MICDSGSGSDTDAAFLKMIWFDSPRVCKWFDSSNDCVTNSIQVSAKFHFNMSRHLWCIDVYPIVWLSVLILLKGRKREDHAEKLSFLLSVMVAFIAIKMLYNTYICISGLFIILFITYFTVQHCVYSSFHLGPEIRLPMHCIMDNSGFRFFQESVKYKWIK